MIGWAFETALALNMLLLLVLVLRGPLARLGGAACAYALWLLPLLRVLTPVDWLTAGAVPSVLPAAASLTSAGGVAASLPPPGGPGQWVPWLLALWVGGAAAFALWQQAAYLLFLRRIEDSVQTRIGRHGGIDVIASAAVDGPLAVGLLRRRILVPLDFASRYTPAERELALAHELVHHRRGDIWWNFAALVLLAPNWFSPIAHAAFRAFRSDQELACDAAVLRGAPAKRHDYARAIVKSASRPGLVAACPLRRAATIKRRLKMMKQSQGRARTAGGIALVIGVLGAGLILSGPGLARPAPPAARPETRSDPIVDKTDIAMLRKACGGPDAAAESKGSRIVCGEGAISNDPEAKAVVRKIIVRTHKTASAAQLNREQLADIDRSIADAHRRIEAIDIEGQLAAAHATIDAARTRTAAAGLGAEDMAELHAALDEARAELADVRLNAADLAEMHAAIEEARREIAGIDWSAIAREIDDGLAEADADTGD